MYVAMFYALLALGLFLGMVILQALGRQLGLRDLRHDPDNAQRGIGAVEGAVFALLGLLLAFTFSGAATRFDTRRHNVVDEINAVDVAYSRLDLVPPEAQPQLRQSFRDYLDARFAVYAAVPDEAAVRTALARLDELQRRVWQQSLAAASAPGAAGSAPRLLLPAVNQMTDVTNRGMRIALVHPPPIIFAMLVMLALFSSLLAGYDLAASRSRHWLHGVGFALVMSFTFYVILDLEFPRLGLIRADAIDQALLNLRASMEPSPSGAG